MAETIQVHTERVDDIPLLIHQQQKMGIPLLDLLKYILYLLLSQLSNFWGAVHCDIKAYKAG